MEQYSPTHPDYYFSFVPTIEQSVCAQGLYVDGICMLTPSLIGKLKSNYLFNLIAVGIRADDDEGAPSSEPSTRRWGKMEHLQLSDCCY